MMQLWRDGSAWGSSSIVFLAVLLVLAGGGPCLGEEPPSKTASVDANTFDAMAKDIEKSVLALGYPKSTADDLVRLVHGWKCERWKQKLSEAHAASPKNTAEIARVEEEVIKRLYDTIGERIATSPEEDEKYFYLSKVVKGKEANCLGYCQLLYILGNSLGLRVTGIDVLESAAEKGHIVCCVELMDGKEMMVDVSRRFVSKPFVFAATYRANGNYWELVQKDNPLGIHRRIRRLDKSGLVAAVYSSLGIAYNKAGDYTQVVRCLNKAIELDPKDHEAYYTRGTAYLKSGQLAKALPDYTKAIELDPKDPKAYNDRGAAHFELGQTANALADFTKVIELDPKDAEAYFNRGIANATTGNTAEAKKDLKKAAELDPALKEQVKNVSNKLRLGL